MRCAGDSDGPGDGGGGPGAFADAGQFQERGGAGLDRPPLLEEGRLLWMEPGSAVPRGPRLRWRCCACHKASACYCSLTCTRFAEELGQCFLTYRALRDVSHPQGFSVTWAPGSCTGTASICGGVPLFHGGHEREVRERSRKEGGSNGESGRPLGCPVVHQGRRKCTELSWKTKLVGVRASWRAVLVHCNLLPVTLGGCEGEGGGRGLVWRR